MFQFMKALMAGALLATSSITFAQPDYNETGWRAATDEEKSLRQAFERGKGTWSKKDGLPQMYDCMLAWALWSDVVRNSGDFFPTVSGDLTHVFADGQLSHYLNTLYAKTGGDVDAFTRNMINSAMRIDQVFELDDMKIAMRQMGKCYVDPASWDFSQGVTMTGPEFMRDFLQQTDTRDVYPVYVRFAAERAEFDQLVMAKKFAEAANYAAALHGDPAKKSTVYWHEVLFLSEMAVSAGEGTSLSDPLLQTLSQVWWPRYKRGWAETLLRAKRGDTRRPDDRSPGVNPRLFEEPGWAKQERESYLAGETNYTPCNMWNRYGC